MRSDTGQVFRLEDYRPSPYLIPRTELIFRLDGEETRVTARLTIERRPGADPALPLVLDGDELSLTRLAVDGIEPDAAACEIGPDRLVIRKPPAASRFLVEIDTRLDPARNEKLMGLFRSNTVYCTQCEAEGFRRITYYLDRPDILSVYRVRIEADRQAAPLLLSNGNPGATSELADGRHFAEWHDPFPKPCYLFALVAGDLGRLADSFTTRSGRKVALNIYVEHGKEARASYAMDALKRAMAWDEEVWGREYDLDVFNVVAVSDFNMGAMENKGLNIFNDKYVLADPDTATDTDYANIEAIVAHEYFHNWTGNRITCRDWFQLCLKEGLTVFRDHEFSADQRSRAVRRIAEVRTLRAHQFPEDQGPLAHPVRPRRYREINNFYTATVYEKGAEVVRMIRTLLGAELFWQGMDLYFRRHDGEAATVEDFVRVFEDVSGRDLAQFALWYHQAGTPNLAVGSRYDPAAREFRLEIEQSLPASAAESRKRLLHIPLAFGLIGADGRDLPVSRVEGAEAKDGVLSLRKRRHVIRFLDVAEQPVASLNRGFSAPVTISGEQSTAALAFLARHDGDLFGRWQALNTIETEALVAGFRRWRAGKPFAFATDIAGLVGGVVGDDQLEPAFRAQALALPGEADIAREIATDIDPDGVFLAREALTAAIAEACRSLFDRLWQTAGGSPGFSPDAASAGRRALAAALLDLLSVADGTPLRAAEAFRRAANMTDRMAALTVLVNRFAGRAETGAALAAFEQRFRDDPLVLDKWFALQATAPGPAALPAVKALMGHSGFSLANPNRVRALIGTYFTANQTGFHRRDGAGYALFGDAVLTLDRRNPQLAARLATALRSWRSLEPERQGKARDALAAIAAQQGLSTDVRDIVERTLG